MNYSHQSEAFVVPPEDIPKISQHLFGMLRDIRRAYELPLDRYPRRGPLNESDHAQRNVIELATLLGIDFGARRGNEINLRDMGDLDNETNG